MAGRSHANPFKTSARTRRSYKRLVGCLTSPFRAMFSVLFKGRRRGKKRRRR